MDEGSQLRHEVGLGLEDRLLGSGRSPVDQVGHRPVALDGTGQAPDLRDEASPDAPSPGVIDQPDVADQRDVVGDLPESLLEQFTTTPQCEIIEE